MSRLLSDISVDTVGTPIDADGGSKTLAVWGSDFGGGTVYIQGRAEGISPWITLKKAGTPVAFTVSDIDVIDYLGVGLEVRAVLSGSSSAIGVYAGIY